MILTLCNPLRIAMTGIANDCFKDKRFDEVLLGIVEGFEGRMSRDHLEKEGVANTFIYLPISSGKGLFDQLHREC